MSRRALAIYIWFTAAYELGILAWFQLREGGPPPVLLDPRGSLEWILASTLSPHYVLVSVISAAWLVVAGFSVISSRRMLWVYGIVESSLAVPTVLLLVAVVLMGSGHIKFSAGDVVLSGMVFSLFSLVPILLAFRLAVKEPSA